MGDIEKLESMEKRGMPQEKIMELLKEAANPSCQHARSNEIQTELVRAAAGGEKDVLSIDDPSAGLRLLLESLYVDTIQNNPEALPSLFPVFATLCGERGNSLVAQVDWSVK